jgi:fermentation-respiration switch protein FrsA (DUF1100 family)
LLALKSIAPESKVLLIHGTDDVTVPPYNATRLAKVIRNCEVRYLQGATHFYPGPHKQGVVEMIKAYFEEQGFAPPVPTDTAQFSVATGFVPEGPADAPAAAKSRL